MSIYYFWYAWSSQLWLHMAGYRNYISSRHVFWLLFCFTDKVRGTKTEQSDVATYGGKICVYIYFLGTLIWLMSNILSADNRPGFQ